MVELLTGEQEVAGSIPVHANVVSSITNPNTFLPFGTASFLMPRTGPLTCASNLTGCDSTDEENFGGYVAGFVGFSSGEILFGNGLQ